MSVEEYRFLNNVNVEKNALEGLVKAAGKYLEEHPEDFSRRQASLLGAAINQCKNDLSRHQEKVNRYAMGRIKEAWGETIRDK